MVGDAERADSNPWLSPVLVAEEDDVNELVRTARAGIAVLSLHLRSAQHEADLASSETDDWDLDAARTLLTAALDQQTQARRREMAVELQQARTEAARLVLSARTKAAELIAAAGEQTLDALLAGAGSSEADAETARSLRVVTEPADVPAPDPVISRTPPPVAHPMVEPAPPPPVVQPTPVAPPQPPIATEPVSVGAHEPPVAAATPADASAQALTALLSAMVAQATTTAAPVAERSEGSPLKRFLYLDVLLPMVAVLIVLVVLLAWVG